MANLFRRITRPPATAGGTRSWPTLSLDAWAGFFGYQGVDYQVQQTGTVTLTQGGQVQEVGSDFRGYVESVYKSNGVVFACVTARMLVFSEARFQFRQRRNGRPGDLFGTPALKRLEVPWQNGTTGDLLSRMLQDADLCGNAYVARRANGLRRMRPDWVTIVGGTNTPLRQRPDNELTFDDLDVEVIGYAYWPGGVQAGNPPEILLAGDVAHFAPIPDPSAAFRGMSWLTPVIREIMADGAATSHKLAFFSNAATPNLAIIGQNLSRDQARDIQSAIYERHAGIHNAYDSLVLGGVDDVKVVGADMKQIDFKTTQGHGETRIAAAAGIPPIIVGLSEGLEAATYCLPARERVWTLEGPRAIADVRPGDAVWSSGGDPSRPSRVTWQGCVGEKMVYEVRTKNRVLRATGSHPVLVRTPGNSRGGNATRHPSVEWRQIDDLRAGDCVVEATSLPDLGEVRAECASPEMARWLGAYVGDGSGAGHGGVSLAIPPADRIREHYERLTVDLFDVRIGHGDRYFRFASRGIAEMLALLGFAGTAKTKRIPGWVFRMPLQHRLEFLAGLMDTDGSIGKSGNGQLGFANRELVEQARMLCISCGIQTTNVSYRRQLPSGLPFPEAATQPFYDMWGFTLTTNLDRIPTADPLYQARLLNRRNAPEGLDAWKAGLDPEALGFFRVRSVTPVGVEPVYDISVEGEHSFFAAGVAVHNSNYGQAVRRFADMTVRPLWRNVAASLASIVDIPGGAELWYDDRDIPFLATDVKDAAEVQATQAQSMRTLIDGGFEADAVVDAITADDLSRLAGKHSGLVPVQLQTPGTEPPAPAAAADGTPALDPAPPQKGLPAPAKKEPAPSGVNGRRLLEQFIRPVQNGQRL